MLGRSLLGSTTSARQNSPKHLNLAAAADRTAAARRAAHPPMLPLSVMMRRSQARLSRQPPAGHAPANMGGGKASSPEAQLAVLLNTHAMCFLIPHFQQTKQTTRGLAAH